MVKYNFQSINEIFNFFWKDYLIVGTIPQCPSLANIPKDPLYLISHLIFYSRVFLYLNSFLFYSFSLFFF